MLVNIGQDLRELLAGFTWNIKGFIDRENRIYAVPEIPQVITGIFEELVVTRIREPLRRKYNCEIIRGGAREYPELTLYGGNIGEGKVAIDVKTARRDKDNPNRTSRMTLGSHGGYFRYPNQKRAGCVFPYGEYTEHWIIGFIYDWNAGRISLELVSNIEIIIQEKWKIASRYTGTGDTAAIGSVNEINRLRAGEGDFSSEEDFVDYWRSRPVRRG